MLTLRHVHKRKQQTKKLPPYPHKKFALRLLDKAVYVAAIGGQVMTVPQIFQIWSTGNAEGVSTLSWVSYSIGSVIWVLYGYAHKEKPIFLSSVLGFAVNMLVVLGSVIY